MKPTLESQLFNFRKEEMVTFLKNHPEFFKNAMELALKDVQPLSWRSAWLLCNCMTNNDTRIRKYLNKIIKVLPGKEDGHQRELIKILLKMKLNEEQEGKLFNVCINLWEGIQKSPSVRITAFKFIYALAEKYPELKSEVQYLTQNHFLETLSPGIKHSISRMLNINSSQEKKIKIL